MDERYDDNLHSAGRSNINALNSSAVVIDGEEEDFPLSYRIIATVIHSLILVLGVFGCIAIIVVSWRERSLHTPTYSYLVSLAYADLLVLCTAVPEALLCHHLGLRWVLGSVGCSLFVFLNFVGINAGSISIFAFTAERYVAICRPLLAHRLCTLSRTKKIILICWIIVVIYSGPWLFLTELKPDPEDPEKYQCGFRVSQDRLTTFFISDIVMFYLCPLILSVAGYAQISMIIKERREEQNDQDQEPTKTLLSSRRSNFARMGSSTSTSLKRSGGSVTSRSTLRMLMVIVALFAVSWLPYRGLLIYNSIADEPWLDIWYLFFAKTMIYINCAMNPLLYNAMNPRFKVAMRKTFCPNSAIQRISRRSTLQSNSASITLDR